jgi:NAD-dependent deacetylase
MRIERLDLDAALAARLREARRVVVFSGAGVSRESGLDTFRGPGGLWETQRPEELATPGAFRATPGRVWRWYGWRYGVAAAAEPNAAHRALARWERIFPSYLLVTQNIDDLHQRAAAELRAGDPAGAADPANLANAVDQAGGAGFARLAAAIVPLHGSLAEAMCESCGRRRPMAEALAESPDEPPACRQPECRRRAARYRPAVVWFGEMLPAAALARAERAAAECDVLVSVGTSAVVYPAAGLIDTALAAGALFIEVNPEATPFSRFAGLRLAAAAGEAMPRLTDAIEACRAPAG